MFWPMLDAIFQGGGRPPYNYNAFHLAFAIMPKIELDFIQKETHVQSNQSMGAPPLVLLFLFID